MTTRITTAFITAVIVALGLGTMACLKAADVQTPKGATTRGEAPCPGAAAGTPAAPSAAQPVNLPLEQTVYKLGKGDGFKVAVDPEISTSPTAICSKDYVVGADGKANFCILGAQTFEGFTEREIEARLTAEFQKQEYYVAPFPKVNVQVTSVKSQTVFLNGEVRTPGSTQIEKPNEMTLMHALANAGGTTPTAGPDIIILRPPRRGPEAEAQPLQIDDATAQRFKYNKKEMMANFQDPPIQAGDTIWVLPAEMFIINGEVKAGGIKVWDVCITVGDAINMASGMTEKGSLGRSHIQRKNARGTFDKIGGLKLETYLLPKDTLVIGRKLF